MTNSLSTKPKRPWVADLIAWFAGTVLVAVLAEVAVPAIQGYDRHDPFSFDQIGSHPDFLLVSASLFAAGLSQVIVTGTIEPSTAFLGVRVTTAIIGSISLLLLMFWYADLTALSSEGHLAASQHSLAISFSVVFGSAIALSTLCIGLAAKARQSA